MTDHENWIELPLGQLLEMIRNGYAGRQVDHITEFPVSRIETISEAKINLQKVGYVQHITDSYLIRPYDILFSNINSLKHIGKLSQLPSDILLYHGMNLLLLRPKKDVDPKFLLYKLTSEKPWFERIATQAINQASINQETLKQLNLQIPKDKNEQNKIAHILSTVDRAIEQTEALIAKQQRIKSGLLQDLLTRGIDEQGNLRLEKTHQFKDSPLGRIPVEWEVPTIGSLATHVRSGSTPRGGESVYQKEGVLFLRSQNIHPMGLSLDEVAHISVGVHHAMKRSAVFTNDVLLNITGASIGRCCYLPDIGSANVNQHVCAIRFQKASVADAQFLAAIIQSNIGQHQIALLNAGGNREGLNFEQVKSFIIPWPNDQERRSIANILQNSKNTINSSTNYLSKLRALKTALMQDLLTGRKRVTTLLHEKEMVNA